MAFSQPETDPFLDSNLPIADIPIDEKVRSTVEERGPEALWSTILNKVLDVDGNDFMGGASYWIDSGVVTWYEDGTTRAINGPLFDPKTNFQLSLQLYGQKAETDKEEIEPTLYICQRAIVRILASHGGSRPIAKFKGNELLPVRTAIYQGYSVLPTPKDGKCEDPNKPPRTIEVEGVTEISAIKIMSAAYRAAQQLKPPRQR